ncbi:O-antigen ligase [Gracilibacillus orientalis]|uniref:O-antigen ligase n=1 Tax=Gracilibacillus orientalis TaxID=334253 RepID=A0A1I4HRG5_9BACI|nr:O-antigen ligase family protein [Gracilibacillus orientalis]SFL43956.1 O-antigen ligase [Gracilibacillus orientalis]
MHWFLFIFLAILFIVSPFQQGLYFDSDFYLIHILIYLFAFLLLIRILYYRKFTAWNDLVLSLFIPICYILSLVQAKHPSGAFEMVFRWTTYISFFYILYWSVNKHHKIRQLAPYIFYISGVLIAYHMLLNQFGLLNYPSAFIKDRFAGVFQYPNTFGMVMIAFYMFGLVMLLGKRQDWRYIFFYSFPLTAFIVTFLESYSRGMYLIFPIVWVIGVCFFTFHYQLRYMLYSMITTLSGFSVFLILQAGNMFLTGISAVVMSLLSVLVIWWISRADALDKEEHMKKFKIHRVVLPAIIVLFGLLLLLDISNQGLVYKQLPTPLQERILSISDSETARERLLILEDAMEASMNSPFIGYGGQAWESIYRDYQQLPYQANKIHNEYAEMIVDIGYLGFLIMISILVYLIVRIWKTMRHAEDRSLYIAILLSLSTIFVHSFIDFNLAFGFVVFMIFWLIAIGLKPSVELNKPQKWPFYTLGVYAVILLFALIFSYRFMQADVAYHKAMDTNNLAEREQYLIKATSYNQFDTEYWYQLSDTLINQSDENKTSDSSIKNTAYIMAELEPMNSQVMYQSGVLLAKINERKDALNQFERALELDPFDSRIYQAIISISVDLAKEQKYSYTNIAMETYKKLLNEYERFEMNPVGSYHNSREFEITDKIEEDIEQIKSLRQ